MLAYTRPRRLLQGPRPSVSRPMPRPRRSVSMCLKFQPTGRGETEPSTTAPPVGLETEASRPTPHPCYPPAKFGVDKSSGFVLEL